MNTLIILGAGIFVVTLCLIQMFLYALRGVRKPETREIRKRLRALSKDEAGTPDILKKNEWGEIVVDCYNQTSVEGIFAAGDVTNVPEKQIIIACGEGSKACLSAFKYLSTHKI